MNPKMINHGNEYLDYCNDIVKKLSEGEPLHIALNMPEQGDASQD